MKESNACEIISIERPFYFLCGPNINHGEKRKILSAYLKKAFIRKTIRPFPIIVDNIFNTPLIDTFKLDLVLLEEIVAATSLKTYIFLDSLSTAYELGLFRNSKSKNSVRILVEEAYDKRERRAVGDYIKKSIGTEAFLMYQSETSGDTKSEHFEFKNSQISDNIKNFIKQEIGDYTKNIQKISLVVGKNDGNPNNVYVEKIDKRLKASFSLKSLFYFMQAYVYSKFSSYKQIKEVSNDKFKILLADFKRFIKRKILINLGDTIDRVTIYDSFEIEVTQFKDNEINEIIRHVYFLIVLLSQGDGSLHKMISTREAFHDVKIEPFEFLNGLGDIFIEIDKKIFKTINNYLAQPDSFVSSVSYVINRKVRKIHKYKDNYNGRQLRFAHERIVSMFNLILPTSSLSFAYKTGCSTLKCISIHTESSNFLKLDIHHYFESIKYGKFAQLFYKQLSKNIIENGIRKYEVYNLKIFNKYIKALFYKGHIPLGFVSSPKVSDFYLNSIDDWAQKNSKIIYSRYADDILFSTRDINYHFSQIRSSFERRIYDMGLTINKNKVIQKKLIKDGDCIKYLGICLVRKGKINEVRISKKYLNCIIKECYEANDKGMLNEEKILGKIRYIKSTSPLSFERLLKALSANPIGKTISNKIQYLLF